MDVDTFLYEDYRIVEAYIKAFRDRVVYEAWIQGAYVHKAVRSALSQVVPPAVARGLGLINANKYKPMIEEYPKEPYSAKELMDDISKEEKFRQDMLDWY